MSTVNEVPKKKEAQDDSMPIMSAPPRDYAPAVKGEGAASGGREEKRTITPIRQLKKEPGSEPEWVKCPFCKETTAVRRTFEPSDEAKCLTACCFCFGSIWFIAPSLLAPGWLVNVDVHCCACEKHIATVAPDGEVQVVRGPDRQQQLRQQQLELALKKNENQRRQK